MNSAKKTEQLIKAIMLKHNKRVKLLKTKLSHGKYHPKNDKVAKAVCSSLESGMAAVRLVVDELN